MTVAMILLLTVIAAAYLLLTGIRVGIELERRRHKREVAEEVVFEDRLRQMFPDYPPDVAGEVNP